MLIRTIDTIRDGNLFSGYRIEPANCVAKYLSTADLLTGPQYAIVGAVDLRQCPPVAPNVDPLMAVRQPAVIALFHRWRAANEALDMLTAGMQTRVSRGNGPGDHVIDLRRLILEGRPTPEQLASQPDGRSRIIDLREDPGEALPPESGNPAEDFLRRLEREQRDIERRVAEWEAQQQAQQAQASRGIYTADAAQNIVSQMQRMARGPSFTPSSIGTGHAR